MLHPTLEQFVTIVMQHTPIPVVKLIRAELSYVHSRGQRLSLSGAVGGGGGGGAAEVADQLYVNLQDNDYLDESGKYSTCMVQFKPLVTALTVAFAHYYVHVFSHPSVMIEAIH